MATTITVRPNSTVDTSGTWALTGGASIQAVTSDNSDATYAGNTGSALAWHRLGYPAQAAPASHGIHRLRGRWRAATTSGSVTTTSRLRRADDTVVGPYTFATATTTIQTFTGSWLVDPTIGSQVALGNVEFAVDRRPGTNTTFRAYEEYVDLDYRHHPDFDPDVLDASGTSRDGGVVADTRTPTVVFGGVDYDGLPALSWQVIVGTFADSGSGVPPGSLVTTPLVDGSYTATFIVRSTIQGSQPFEHIEQINFEVAASAPPPPPALSATPQDDGILLQWTGSAGVFDDDRAVIEIFRDDCYGTDQRIAVIDNALNGSYLDRAAPILDQRPDPTTCVAAPCPITYRARYWGIQSVLSVQFIVTSEFAEVAADALTTEPGIDRLVGEDSTAEVCPERSYTRPRQGKVSPPFVGGLPTVLTTSPGEDLDLQMAVVGRGSLSALETVLRQERIWYTPYGGVPGWYAPSTFQVRPVTPRTWAVSISMVRAEPLPLPDPEELLASG